MHNAAEPDAALMIHGELRGGFRTWINLRDAIVDELQSLVRTRDDHQRSQQPGRAGDSDADDTASDDSG